MLLAFGPASPGAAETGTGIVKVGAGAYSRTLISGEKPPSDRRGQPIVPKVTARFKDAATSNDWWSSLIWQHDETNPYSGNLFPHPLAVKARAEGLGMGYPTRPEIQPRAYWYPYAEDLTAGLKGLKAKDTRVEGYSDWTVTAAWEDGAKYLEATTGHGMPYVYFTKRGGDAAVAWAAAASIWSDAQGALGVTINGHHYGIFAPHGSAWVRGKDGATSTLSGKDFFSVAVLPDSGAETLELFRKHAFAFVTGTKVSWEYTAKGRLASTFTFTTDLKEKGHGNLETPLVALYRHQWLNTKAPLTRYSYVSPRGMMKVMEGSSFTTDMGFDGVLPVLPAAADGGGYKAGKLKSLVKEAYKGGELFPKGMEGAKDTYWEGKSLVRNTTLLRIADQLGYDDARQGLLKAVKEELQAWLDGKSPAYFYYDSTWRTLIGLPSVYRSGWEMNDHHFHNGYYILAAAQVAQYDPAWASDAQWGGMIKLLIKDPANWDRQDSRFPFLRYFDAYAGHSWANGPALFPEGNNEESSSEDLLLSTAIILWGTATGDNAIRDLGIFLYANQVAAVEQYWFDADAQVFPKGFGHPVVAMVWGSGGKYDTWWSQNPVYIHGIEYLPFTGGSLYLGRRAERLGKAYAVLEKENRGPVRLWRDVHWMALALSDPQQALKLWEQDSHYDPEWGHTRAQTYHWIHNLAALGKVDTTVTSAWPLRAVFRKGETRTYAVANPTSKPLRVSFSDGFEMEAPPGANLHRSQKIPQP